MKNRFTLEPDFDSPNKLYIYDNINGKAIWAILYGQAQLAGIVCQFLNRQNEENPLMKV